MYKFVDHTADVKVIATGKTFEDALQSIVDAVVSLISKQNRKGASPEIKKEFSFKGKFREDLIIGLIEDILYRIETLRLVPKRVKLKNINLSNFSVDYLIIGNHGIANNIIKAATFHQLSIKRGKEWRIEVVLDV